MDGSDFCGQGRAHGCGQRGVLRAPPSRTDPPVPHRRGILPGFPGPDGGTRPGVTAGRATRVRGLPALRPAGTRLPAGTLRALPRREAGCLQLQAARLLPELRRAAHERLSRTPQGKVCYRLKTPYRDGTTHVLFEPLDFIARLAALVPKPRVNLTRFHGVFASNSHRREQITPGQRARHTGEETDGTAAAGHAAMTPDRVRGRLWAQRLKRVFKIDIETCSHCGGAVKIIACIEDPMVIEKILTHLNEKAAGAKPTRLPECRAPPQAVLFN